MPNGSSFICVGLTILSGTLATSLNATDESLGFQSLPPRAIPSTSESSVFDSIATARVFEMIEPSWFSFDFLRENQDRTSRQPPDSLAEATTGLLMPCKFSQASNDGQPDSLEARAVDSSGYSTPQIAWETRRELESPEVRQWRPIDSLELFGGLEGSKQPQDFGVNANFGGRFAANWGFPLLAEHGLGCQIGTSINYTDNAVEVFRRVGASTQRTQNFSTIGLFQRTENWRWGLGYDVAFESYYDQFVLGQWRGRVGYAPSKRNEFGVWFTVPQQRDSGNFLNVPVQLLPLGQGNVYWQHQFAAGSRVTGWAGVAQGHAQDNYALGDEKRTESQFVFGAEIDVPLNPYLSIYGQANFIRPADTGTVDSFLGLTYYPGGRAFPGTRSLFAPFQALANSPMFAVDMRR